MLNIFGSIVLFFILTFFFVFVVCCACEVAFRLFNKD
ncbi:hypothetical protein VIOLETTEMAD_27 [Bacillus phage VioletteMad]|uniref:Uncharacterized protein n=1 Tax=Bacillus phage VioletteMad TaxID=2023952 RepID=A0A514AAM9_9CAUD|nr:hypothetical protein VIOLETTEMAD_27 [Bacillus phage VioletteMad]